MQQKLVNEFQRQFNNSPKYLIKAPGRVNLIGEHTDYNNGFVLPIAIERYIWMALTPRKDSMVKIYSMNFKHTKTFDLNILQHNAKGWIEYAKGIAKHMQDQFGNLCGFDAVLRGNIPRGAGLSSSAAIELAIARAFATTTDISWDPVAMAQLAQQAENQWVGVNCGIMDQMVIAAAKADHALLIDCESLELTQIPMPKDISIVIMDTNTRRGLVDSKYNERRQQCEQAAKILQVNSLREVTSDMWQESQKSLSGDCLKRARHVITENQRVLDAVNALQKDDMTRLGELMNASHESLREDFEVSTNNLDIIINAARSAAGCFGARMTGAGFGGCAVAVVKSMYADDFAVQVAEQYQYETKLEPRLYITNAVDGITVAPHRHTAA